MCLSAYGYIQVAATGGLKIGILGYGSFEIGISGYGPFEIGISGYGSFEIGIFGILGPPLRHPYYCRR